MNDWLHYVTFNKLQIIRLKSLFQGIRRIYYLKIDIYMFYNTIWNLNFQKSKFSIWIFPIFTDQYRLAFFTFYLTKSHFSIGHLQSNQVQMTDIFLRSGVSQQELLLYNLAKYLKKFPHWYILYGNSTAPWEYARNIVVG